MPSSSRPSASSVVPIGRSMKGREKFMTYSAGASRERLGLLLDGGRTGASRARTRSMAR